MKFLHSHATRRSVLGAGALIGAGLITATPEAAGANGPADGPGIRIFDSSARAVLDPDTPVEVLAQGFAWSEGPCWDRKRSRLYFSDIPNNRIHSWSRAAGLGIWRAPAGSGDADDGVMPGTNGLHYDAQSDTVLVCDQDARTILRYDAEGATGSDILRPDPAKAFNSPNDLTVGRDGTMYFTDPPYGLRAGNASELKARACNGVYRRAPDGTVELIDDSLTFPNGIGLSPDERVLYVAISDPVWPRLVRYHRDESGWRSEGDCWFDMRMFQHDGSPGMPDGMAIAENGCILASAPGGVALISPDGRALGKIETGRATGNCCFGGSGKDLFITAADMLLSVRLSMSGSEFIS